MFDNLQSKQKDKNKQTVGPCMSPGPLEETLQIIEVVIERNDDVIGRMVIPSNSR